MVADLLDVLEIEEHRVLVGHSSGRRRHQARARHAVTSARAGTGHSSGGSAWRNGRTCAASANGRVGLGCTSPSDVWPMRQATRYCPVIFEDIVNHLVRNPRAIVRVANLARRPDRRRARATARSRLPITIVGDS